MKHYKDQFSERIIMTGAIILLFTIIAYTCIGCKEKQIVIPDDELQRFESTLIGTWIYEGRIISFSDGNVCSYQKDLSRLELHAAKWEAIKEESIELRIFFEGVILFKVQEWSQFKIKTDIGDLIKK
jgi:hypothetical protein